ncbi:MAG TPA: hypothetical protein VIW92_10795 [Thermoanaerobaculia bacterium]
MKETSPETEPLEGEAAPAGGPGLRDAMGAADHYPCRESISYRITQLCASAQYTNCVECNS